MNSRGFALIYVIMLAGAVILAGGALASTAYSTMAQARLNAELVSAFYLAEAALEHGKALLHNNPAWYTDLHSPADRVKWLKGPAAGEKTVLGGGRYFKTVRIMNDGAIYGVGHCNGSYAIIMLENGRFEEL